MVLDKIQSYSFVKMKDPVSEMRLSFYDMNYAVQITSKNQNKQCEYLNYG